MSEVPLYSDFILTLFEDCVPSRLRPTPRPIVSEYSMHTAMSCLRAPPLQPARELIEHKTSMTTYLDPLRLSTCLTQLTLGAYVVQIWSRNTLKFRGNETFELHRVGGCIRKHRPHLARGATPHLPQLPCCRWQKATDLLPMADLLQMANTGLARSAAFHQPPAAHTGVPRSRKGHIQDSHGQILAFVRLTF